MDRRDWVPLSELREGERLLCAHPSPPWGRGTEGEGAHAIVLGVTLSTVCEPVYNLEIHGEHVYQVGELGVLVHNAGADNYEVGRNAPKRSADALEEGLSIRRGVDIGIKRPPRHHIFPQEMLDFFKQRGFEDLDNYTIPLDEATHQAIHKWMGSGAWNDVMKSRILVEESKLGRLLTRREILDIGAKMRREAGLNHIKIIPFQD